MRLIVNGVQRELVSPPLASLLHALREELGVTSAKAGCQQGGCGACTVLVDGEPRRACLMPLAAVDGVKITTVEGLGNPTDLAPIQAAFNEHYAAQCGYCTAGFLMAAQALIDDGGGHSRQEVQEALAGHVCRCTGYVKIIDAVTAAARGEVGPQSVQADLGARGEDAAAPIPGSPA